ncbi:universal stress protein [Maribacter sp. HTCC2170]|uniref:universal stress protein n=1 Tax=Maribacter sp. (strain HTCC2170 / KCCM 42371) TaxID=313603 RepID=UPI00006B47E5|nr:universal stress protein [Maribacter sp. HTCC2170]EAR01740.1 putative universal stress protein UspA [Maribacter sp. HTCC2170]
MKRIILPTDFSDNAYNAICYALNLFKDEESTFYLLHTYTPAIYQAEYVLHSPGQIGLGDIYQENSLTQLEDLKAQLKTEFNNKKHTFMVHSAFNTLVDEIVETSKSENADLVIMGTQGATGAKEILIGTNTVHVIKKACCPVIAIPPKFKYETPKEILFPTDLEINFQEEQLKELNFLAKNHISRIDVIHVSAGYDLSKTQLKNKSRLDDIFSGIAHLFHELPNQEVITAINNFQSKHKVNLLVMIQNRHTFLERLFIEPVIKKLGFHVTIPFMVIPPHKNN